MEVSDKRHAQVGATKDLLDEMIDRHAEAYIEAFPEIKEFSDFERSGTGKYYIGMVWTSDFEKPDTQQLVIRTSFNLANNRPCFLDLRALNEQHIFYPGQIIAFLGDPYVKNQPLMVRKLLDSTRVAPRMKSINTDNPIRLIIASGPYMKPEHEDWELYDKIIDQIKEQNATHVVLLGPFVDLENKTMRNNYDVNWRSIFDKLIVGLIEHSCHVYLVPSSRDVLPSYLSATYFYPSRPLEFEVRLKDGVIPKCKVTSVSDPAQIDLGGIYLDMTSAEVLFHLNKCSSFINKGGSVFESMHEQLISQGIYSIYPPPADFAIDYPKLVKHIQLDRLGPHILVLPSRFNTSVNEVKKRLVVTIQKCSTKKQIVLIDIPRVESNSENLIDSVVTSGYEHKMIDLVNELTNL